MNKKILKNISTITGFLALILYFNKLFVSAFILFTISLALHIIFVKSPYSFLLILVYLFLLASANIVKNIYIIIFLGLLIISIGCFDAFNIFKEYKLFPHIIS